MLLLTSTSDLLKVTTGSAGQVDVHASYADVASGTVSLGRTNSRITTAATTNVVGSPGASTSRNVKTLHIVNSHASISNLITITHTDGTTTVQLHPAITLLPGESLIYIEGAGFIHFNAAGQVDQENVNAITGNGATSAQGPGFATDTYLVGSSIPIAGRIKAGSSIDIYMTATKTAAGTAAPVFTIRKGTAVSTADTSVLALTTSAQTAAADTARIRLAITFRAVGASAVIQAGLEISHNLAATGFASSGPAGQNQVIGTSASFDATPAGTVMGLSVNGGASASWTIEQVVTKAVAFIA